MGALRFLVGDVELLRVGYADVTIPPERVGITPEQVAGVAWAEPLWADGAELRAGAAAWVIRSGDALIVVDPAMAADEILRSPADAAAHQDAFAALLAEAGVPREEVTHAIATHVEGIGMFAWRNDDGSWSPFFTNAPLLVSHAELDALDAAAHPSPLHTEFDELRAQGIVRAIEDANDGTGTEIAPGVTVEVVGGHTPGHMIVRIASSGESAVMLGHLTVSPLHLATGECPQQHPQPATVEAALAALREEDDALLIGPLWPSPGAGRWISGGLVAAAGVPV